MKQTRLFVMLCVAVLTAGVQTTQATIVDIPKPDMGDATLVVCAQNLRNYTTDFTASRADCNNAECFAAKTNKIVQSLLYIDADIYAFCELEAKEAVLKQLVDSMNKSAGAVKYAFVSDGIDDENTYVRSGFVYRLDRVRTVGTNKAASSAYYYRYTMRYQMFEEIATGERFTLSMNHFKAKDNTEDNGNAKREANANDLVSAMNSVSIDPDILIVGDLNCTVTESPIQIILNAGYTEQLLRYDASAYSHCYSGQQLIDHALANATMATQVTGAGVVHICTSCGSTYTYDYTYSDHDPYMVGLKLYTEGGDTPCEDIDYSETFYSSLGKFTSINVSGDNDWYCDANYHYAKMNGTASDDNEDWLISPAFDLSGHSNATLSFDHTANKGNSSKKTTMQTLWMSSDYDGGMPASATWTQVTIPTYPTGTNWNFVNSGNIRIPSEFLTANMHFAFKYVAATKSEGSCWEIKNVKVNALCEDEMGVEQPTESAASVYVADGYIYGAKDMRIYTILGMDVTNQNGALHGIYIVKSGDESVKVMVR